MIYPEWEQLLMIGSGLAIAFVVVIAGLIRCYRAPKAAVDRKFLHVIALTVLAALLGTGGLIGEVIANRQGARFLLPLIMPFVALAFSLEMNRALLTKSPQGIASAPPDPESGETK